MGWREVASQGLAEAHVEPASHFTLVTQHSQLCQEQIVDFLQPLTLNKHNLTAWQQVLRACSRVASASACVAYDHALFRADT
eukprot:2519810-Amphidinium_carterae.1